MLHISRWPRWCRKTLLRDHSSTAHFGIEQILQGNENCPSIEVSHECITVQTALTEEEVQEAERRFHACLDCLHSKSTGVMLSNGVDKDGTTHFDERIVLTSLQSVSQLAELLLDIDVSGPGTPHWLTAAEKDVESFTSLDRVTETTEAAPEAEAGTVEEAETEAMAEAETPPAPEAEAPEASPCHIEAEEVPPEAEASPCHDEAEEVPPEAEASPCHKEAEEVPPEAEASPCHKEAEEVPPEAEASPEYGPEAAAGAPVAPPEAAEEVSREYGPEAAAEAPHVAPPEAAAVEVSPEYDPEVAAEAPHVAPPEPLVPEVDVDAELASPYSGISFATVSESPSTTSRTDVGLKSLVTTLCDASGSVVEKLQGIFTPAILQHLAAQRTSLLTSSNTRVFLFRLGRRLCIGSFVVDLKSFDPHCHTFHCVPTSTSGLGPRRANGISFRNRMAQTRLDRR